jgi:hypothetical protein
MAVGFRSAGPSGSLSKAQDLIKTPYMGVNVPAYVPPPDPPAPPPVDYSDGDNETVGRPEEMNQASLDVVTNQPSYSFETDPLGNPTTMGMTQAQIENPVANPVDFYGNPVVPEVYSPSPVGAIPGASIMSLGQPSIPTSGYGTPGTYSGLTGGQFNQSSQAVDPITGQPIAEYGTTGAFLDSLMDDPLANTTSPQGKLSDMEYAGQTSSLASLGAGTTDPTGNPATTGLDQDAKDKVATQLGLDMGFPAHTVAPGTPTHTAISTGQVTPGSQYSPTGTFTNAPTEGVNTSDPNSTGASTGIGGSASGVSGLGDESGQGTGSSSSSATAGQDTATSGPTGTSYADDAQGSGGGDSGGK